MGCVRFEGEINEYSVERLLRRLRQVNAPRSVYVSSPGGRFELFSILGPAIERQGIVTLAGEVRSAATILFLLGHTRKAFPNSTFFFHEVRTLVGFYDSGITIADLEEVEWYQNEMSGRSKETYQEWLRQMKSAESWFLQYINAKTGVPTGMLRNLMRSEATLSAREARQYGIVHEIVPQVEIED